MKIKSTIMGLALAGICLASPAIVTAESLGSAIDSATGQIQTQNPTDANRGSKIIGMNIDNQQNQKLGTVKDLIVDFKSQRVAYAWVKKSDETGNTGKYVAVPISVFQPSSDAKNLVLNVDKNRFDSAQGYADANQLPQIPLAGSQLSFWQSISEAAGAQNQK